MKTITIENDTTRTILVDDEDYDRISKFKWYGHGRTKQTIARNIYYVEKKEIHASGYETPIIFRKKCAKYVSLACEVMQQFDCMFDHKDRNSCNNQKDNLRKCTTAQNNINTTKRKGTSSKYRGVSWNPINKKWIAAIRHKRIKYYLGSFLKEEDAAQVYNTKAKELFGDFVVLNVIEA
jgi:hypothetical protein